MKILITGCNGFIGFSLAKKYLPEEIINKKKKVLKYQLKNGLDMS